MSKLLSILIMCVFIAQSSFAQSYSETYRLANQDTVNFTFTVRKPDIKAIDCYPQQITQISKKGDNYEDSIAKQIDAGNCRTVDVNTVIQTRKGTCSEYTNVFTALMRYMNIPTRFAVGYFNVPEWKAESTHAWPECYIEGAGWCTVDPTFPTYIGPNFAGIRMRYGIDYEDCDIKTLDYDIEPIEFTKR